MDIRYVLYMKWEIKNIKMIYYESMTIKVIDSFIMLKYNRAIY